jgi:hypothetical protein
VSLFTPGPPVLSGVDEVLRVLTTEALKGLATPVAVSVGPLDRPPDGPRLNWFLYRVEPAAAYANMEPPGSGWRTRRGHPPLALTLHYLLTADAGELTESGTEDDVVHAALSALMSALHGNGILGVDTLVGSGPDRTVSDVAGALDDMVEPLRITLEQIPVETIASLWNTGSHALRLSLGYAVSLVTVPAQTAFAPGPPVLSRRDGVAPAAGPDLHRVAPAVAFFDQPVTIDVGDLTDTHRVTLGRLAGDPDDPTDGRPDPAHTHSTGPWVLTEAPTPTGLDVHLPRGALVPGARALVVTNLADGLPAGSDHAVVTVVPVVVSAAAPLQSGATATLTVRHVDGDGQAFFGGRAAAYTVSGPTTVDVTVPDLPPEAGGATIPVSLRCGTVTGPPTEVAVA